MTLYDICRAECIRQHDDSPAKVKGLMDAINYMRVASARPNWPLELDIQVMAGLINCTKTPMPYRRVPAVFNQGLPAVDPGVIPDVMPVIVKWLNEKEVPVDEIIKWFLDIHPFSDGNGRVAFVLYNWLNGTLDNPVTLPYYYGME